MSGAAAVLVLTVAQKYWAVRSFQIGEQQNVGYTLSAISYQESSFCKFKVNHYSRGCTGLKRSTARLFDPSVTRLQLTNDNERNIRDGLAFLLYCKARTNSWKRMVAAFHYGVPAESKMSDAQIVSDGYVKAIEEKVRALEGVKQNHE